MLLLMPQLVVPTATALASWTPPIEEETDADRERTEATRGVASLRFVDFAGFWSHFAHDLECSSWPLPRCAQLAELAEFAEEHHVLVPSPLAGDVFLLASANADRHVSAGIVATVESVIRLLDGSLAFVCTTIEGELDATAEAPEHDDRRNLTPRFGTARLVRRRLSPVFGDCFIRWCDLPARISRVTIQYDEPKNLAASNRTGRPDAA